MSGDASRRSRFGSGVVCAVVLALGLVAPLASGAAAARAQARARPTRRRAGGTLTVLEPSLFWSDGLDPFTNPNAASDQTMEDAVFGELFALGPHGTTIDDLASGAQLGDGDRVLTIDLRAGVTFSDGSPFNSAAVVYSLRHDQTAACACAPSWPVRSIRADGPDKVVISLTRPDAAIVDQFQDSVVNWIASPTALRKMGTSAFDNAPVGAGPFEVVRDATNSSLVLRRNPRYWQKGHPYLSGLVFRSESGYGYRAAFTSLLELAALRSGAGQALEGMDAPGNLASFTSAGFTATLEPSSAPYVVALDTARPPFDRRAARQAVYAATNAAALDRALNGDVVPPTESFTSPTDRFYEPTVPGYQTYDLGEAKRLVRSLGGLHVRLLVAPTLANTLGTALVSLYEQAGMQVSLTNDPGARWDAVVRQLGSFDPAGPSGLAAYERVPGLGGVLVKAGAATSRRARATLYATAAKDFAVDALGPFLYPPASWSIVRRGVRGPGLTTPLPSNGDGPAVLWQDVSMAG